MARYHPNALAIPTAYYAAAYDGRGWRRLIPDLELTRIPGGHLECLTVNVGILAEHLQKKLHEIDCAG